MHFQVQTTPYVGSKTLAYPFAFYKLKKQAITSISEFKIPEETEFVSNANINESLSKAFEFKPGLSLELHSETLGTTTWEVFTDVFNYNYIFCYQTKAIAYFIKKKNSFYFVSFSGSEESLLYYFYLSSYRVSLITESQGVTNDSFPLQLSRNNPGKWLQDFLAPFYIFRRLRFESNFKLTSGANPKTITIESKQTLHYFNKIWIKSESEITIDSGIIQSFKITKGNKTIQAKCIIKS